VPLGWGRVGEKMSKWIRRLNTKIRTMDQDTFNVIMYCITGALILAAFVYMLPGSLDQWMTNMDNKYLAWAFRR